MSAEVISISRRCLGEREFPFSRWAVNASVSTAQILSDMTTALVLLEIPAIPADNNDRVLR